MEWRMKDGRGLVKAKAEKSAGNVMSTAFWDMKCVLYNDFKHRKEKGKNMVNALYYATLLMGPCETRIPLKMRRHANKLKYLASQQCLSSHCRIHMSNVLRTWLEDIGTSPYNPDLSQCDYHIFIFKPLNEALDRLYTYHKIYKNVPEMQKMKSV